MPSNPIVADAAEGVTKGVISWGEEKIKQLVTRLRNKELAFIQDQGTIDIVKEQLLSGEWTLYQSNIQDKKLRILVQMGLALRDFDKQKKHDQREHLRTKIFNKYDEQGLHISEFVEANRLKLFLTKMATESISNMALVKRVEDLLNNLDKYTIFIQKEDNLKRKIREINTRLDAHVPSTFIVFSNYSAMLKGKKIFRVLHKERLDYNSYYEENESSFLIFFTRKSQRFTSDFF